MIEEMVAARWRMRRAWAIETHMLGTEAADPDSPAAASSETSDPIGRQTPFSPAQPPNPDDPE